MKQMSLQTDISDRPFNQKSPQHPEEGVLNCDRKTDRTSADSGPIQWKGSRLNGAKLFIEEKTIY